MISRCVPAVARSIMRRFSTCRRGSTAVIFAFSLVPLAAAIGAAIDYSLAYRIRAELQNAVDSAVIAGAQRRAVAGGDPTDLVALKIAKNFTQKHDGITPAIDTRVRPDGSVISTVSLTLPTHFLSIVGIENVEIEVESEARFGIGNAEVALVLDNTFSMSGAKLDGLKSAARLLVDSIYSGPGAESRVKVSLVPFAQYVNVGVENRSALWMSVPPDRSETTRQCWMDYPILSQTNCRTVHGTCNSDGTPYACSWTECDTVYGDPVERCGDVTTNYTWNGCAGSRNRPLNTQALVENASPVPGILNAWCPSRLARLTHSKRDILDQITSMTATGETYIPSGLIWGWRTLSPDAPFADAGPSTGADRPRKILVLMTDGANTKSANYPDHEGGDAAAANAITAELCTNIKGAGIEIFTVAFNVVDVATRDMLQACATSEPHYYNASGVTGLEAAFAQIGQSITAVRLAR